MDRRNVLVKLPIGRCGRVRWHCEQLEYPYIALSDEHISFECKIRRTYLQESCRPYLISFTDFSVQKYPFDVTRKHLGQSKEDIDQMLKSLMRQVQGIKTHYTHSNNEIVACKKHCNIFSRQHTSIGSLEE